jgi:hypothetical protein
MRNARLVNAGQEPHSRVRAGGRRNGRVAPRGATVSASLGNETSMKNSMSPLKKVLCAAMLPLGLATTSALAQTAGGARIETTILDYNGSGAAHYTVVWVTTESGTFIKSLRKQGPNNWTSSQWGNHCGTWNTARGGSTALDGYSSATATSYTGTNNPIIWTWNCRDGSNNLMANGNYKFWVQYAEDNGQGPYTTSGLLWTKGPSGPTTNTYANQGANFSNMKVVWTPSVGVPPVAPTITSAAPPGTGTVGVPYNFNCTATGTAPIKFSAVNLPMGLTIRTNGVISGTPTAGATFNGTISATNGTLPNATQPFNIVISVVPASFTSVRAQGSNLEMGGSGPANGIYAVLVATNAGLVTPQWTPVATSSIGSNGEFSYTNAINPSGPASFFRLRLP